MDEGVGLTERAGVAGYARTAGTVPGRPDRYQSTMDGTDSSDHPVGRDMSTTRQPSPFGVTYQRGVRSDLLCAEWHDYVAELDLGDLEAVASTLDELTATFSSLFPAVASPTRHRE